MCIFYGRKWYENKELSISLHKGEGGILKHPLVLLTSHSLVSSREVIVLYGLLGCLLAASPCAP